DIALLLAAPSRQRNEGLHCGPGPDNLPSHSGYRCAPWPLVAEAQQSRKVVRLGQLGPGPPGCFNPFHPAEVALRRGLEDAGYVIGQTIVIERRCFPRMEQLPDVAADLVKSRPDILVVFSAPAALAAKRADLHTPIVFIDASEVIRNGLVASLARPGGNATGLTSITREVTAKRLELFQELIPEARHIGVLANPTSAATAGQIQSLEHAANSRALKLSVMSTSTESDLVDAFSEMRPRHPDGLVVFADPFFFTQQERIVSLEKQVSFPAMYSHTPFVKSGGLIAYAADLNDMSRRAANYVDKILKGA